MTKVFEAFGGISDEYILATLAYCKHRTRTVILKIGMAAACLTILISCFVIHSLTQSKSDSGYEKPQRGYGVGETVMINNNKIEVEYIECTKTFVRFTAKNLTEEDLEIEAQFEAVLCVGENTRYPYITSTDPNYKHSGSFQTISGILKIYIDGTEADRLIIPGDNEEHEIIIDFSYFPDNGYIVRNSWWLDYTLFIMPWVYE